jgi:histidyl-tRNA synthetase
VVASGERSLKAQMRQAGQLGARHAAILGEREMADSTVTLKYLGDGSQQTVALSEVISRVNDWQRAEIDEQSI